MEVEIKYDGEILARINVVDAVDPVQATDAVRNRLAVTAWRPSHTLNLAPNKIGRDTVPLDQPREKSIADNPIPYVPIRER